LPGNHGNPLIPKGSKVFLILLAAAMPTAVDADRALARAVQKEGQWTAFRRFAAPGAVMFQRGAHDAASLLAGQPDPKKPFTWEVHESITSCDGTTAITIGPVRQADGRDGMLLLVWRKQPDGSWKWVVWRGGAGRTPEPGPVPRTITASCEGEPPLYVRRQPEGPSGTVSSPDRTLIWYWETDRTGAVTYYIQAWNGTAHKTVVGGDRVSVPGK
jgi:hypothetical protein